MRLLAHNMLQCHVKGCTDNYPLKINDAELESLETEVDLELVRRLLPKLDYAALQATCSDIGIAIPQQMDESDEFLQGIAQVLLQVRVKNAQMACTGCGHVYPIINGIPNMLLQESEV